MTLMYHPHPKKKEQPYRMYILLSCLPFYIKNTHTHPQPLSLFTKKTESNVETIKTFIFVILLYSCEYKVKKLDSDDTVFVFKRLHRGDKLFVYALEEILYFRPFLCQSCRPGHT